MKKVIFILFVLAVLFTSVFPVSAAKKPSAWIVDIETDPNRIYACFPAQWPDTEDCAWLLVTDRTKIVGYEHKDIGFEDLEIDMKTLIDIYWDEGVLCARLITILN